MSERAEQSGRLLVYRSSAGSGKTSTLVSTFLKAALEGQDPSDYGKILAITFTNKAAKEMKERVLLELDALASGKPVSPPTRQEVDDLGLDDETLRDLASRTLTHLLHHYSRLSISTIDRFVHRIVQQFARELDIPVDFELVMEEDEVLERAIDTLIAKAGGSEEAITKALTGFASAKAEEDKSWHIEQDLLEASHTLLEEDGMNAWQSLKGIGPEQIIEARKKAGAERKRFEERLEKIADRGQGLIEQEGLRPEHFYKGKQGGVPSYLKKLKKRDPNDLAPTATLLKGLEEDKWVSGKCPSEEAERIHRISGTLRSLLEEAITLYQQEGGRYIFLTLIHQELYRLSLLSGIEEALERIKEEEGLLLISDLDRIIAKLVIREPAPFIYERIGDRYDHILFDEFQDTSILQWQNLLPLVENSLSEGNTVMLVGDGKQAIYRWRNGDVEQFLKLPSIHKSQEEQDLIQEKEETLKAHYEERSLAQNFRSAPRIVETNNELFPIMNRILMEGAEEAGMGHLKRLFDEGGQVSKEEAKSGYLLFRPVPEDEEQEEEQYPPLIEHCLQLLRGPLKDAERSKIAILTRKNREGADIAAALMEEGIDVISSESLHLDQSNEVNFLIALMRIVEDPGNEIAKLEAIRYLLAYEGREDELHERIAPHWSTDEKGKEGGINIQGFWEAHDTPYDPIAAQSSSLYRIAEDAVRCFYLDRPASPYIQFFLDHVFSFSERYGDDIQAFLEDWDGMKNKPSIKVPSDIDAVRVMTIHSAKGLEFPYVIIPGPEGSIRYSKDRIWVNPNGYLEELPATLVPMNKQLGKCPEPYAQEEAMERYRSRLDALDLLYVAMTRAEEGLFVLLPPPPKDSEPATRIDKTLWKALEERYGELPEEGLQFGELIPEKEEDEGDGGEPLEAIPHAAWDERVKIRFKAPKDPSFDDPEAERKSGELIHEALARTHAPEQLSSVLDEMVSEGSISVGERKELGHSLQNLIERPEIAPYFSPGKDQKLYCEREILSPEGYSLRPDRVLIQGDEACILEIKTGVADPSHHQQLQRYCNVLRKMGYSAEGKLLYTEQGELVPLEES